MSAAGRIVITTWRSIRRAALAETKRPAVGMLALAAALVGVSGTAAAQQRDPPDCDSLVRAAREAYARQGQTDADLPQLSYTARFSNPTIKTALSNDNFNDRMLVSFELRGQPRFTLGPFCAIAEGAVVVDGADGATFGKSGQSTPVTQKNKLPARTLVVKQGLNELAKQTAQSEWHLVGLNSFVPDKIREDGTIRASLKREEQTFALAKQKREPSDYESNDFLAGVYLTSDLPVVKQNPRTNSAARFWMPGPLKTPQLVLCDGPCDVVFSQILVDDERGRSLDMRQREPVGVPAAEEETTSPDVVAPAASAPAPDSDVRIRFVDHNNKPVAWPEDVSIKLEGCTPEPQPVEGDPKVRRLTDVGAMVADCLVVYGPSGRPYPRVGVTSGEVSFEIDRRVDLRQLKIVLKDGALLPHHCKLTLVHHPPREGEGVSYELVEAGRSSSDNNDMHYSISNKDPESPSTQVEPGLLKLKLESDDLCIATDSNPGELAKALEDGHLVGTYRINRPRVEVFLNPGASSYTSGGEEIVYEALKGALTTLLNKDGASAVRVYATPGYGGKLPNPIAEANLRFTPNWPTWQTVTAEAKDGSGYNSAQIDKWYQETLKDRAVGGQGAPQAIFVFLNVEVPLNVKSCDDLIHGIKAVHGFAHPSDGGSAGAFRSLLVVPVDPSDSAHGGTELLNNAAVVKPSDYFRDVASGPWPEGLVLCVGDDDTIVAVQSANRSEWEPSPTVPMTNFFDAIFRRFTQTN